ncbi:hypothetical protein HCZ23_13925 [Celeribacter sp. HF31]|uniref:hypothetical protein n=1 Tax=Celeribacter sp. HF31 TaxID=2721558 RepID=UPI00142F807C|nr:hypothetical protein [Celeribacter sp. HF31]NIY80560.1 hypothetical protein [Celeribacter sp. HF31]
MGTLGKTLSIVGAVVGMVISVLVYAEISRTQKGVQIALTESFQGSSYFRDSSEDDLPKLTTERIAAPKNGSEARSFEIEHVDESADLQDGVAAEAAVEPEAPGLPDDATMGEKLSYYVDRLIAWFVGEKEETLHMDCKTKKDGGKVCSVVRK